MKPKTILILAGSVVLSGLFLYSFFSVRSCVREKQWLALGPIENHPVRIFDVKYAREFNDMNPVHLAAAEAIGVKPVKDREEADKMKGKLVLLEDTDTYVIRDLTHSIPYVVPEAKELLDLIGKNFQDSLASHGLNPNKMVITSVMRTEDDVAALRKHNVNASENSSHRYGTTFDLSYWRYVKIEELRGRPYEDVPPEYLRAVLGQVLRDIHNQGLCYIKYERKQNCFHITVKAK
ncbi:MAG: hypothetical protein IK052_07495 [Bacteroidales bacterium]|nr:hypothetical protein [Bacteroidales bacterium]